MALRIEQKKQIVEKVSGVADGAISAVIAEYRGISSADMTSLRANARKAGVHVQVVPNKLAKRAIKDTGFACLDPVMKGPLIMAFAKEEPSAAARLLRDFAKSHDKLVVKGLAVDGNLLGAEQLDTVAKLPTRLEALAQVACVMKAPITKLVRTTSETYASLVRVIAAVRDQKEANG